ncbi:hypothetical protein HU200_017146 [Digitaria exilis]|uniref:Hexosyltransferase n=1 Tax=Digitaria exilis TaxID=1010633 RepID=A0A835KI27_9POAL|nr:hypothetical protein HU200_017146 [Digitaria exilis]
MSRMSSRPLCLALLSVILVTVIYLVVFPDDGSKLTDVFGPGSSSSWDSNGAGVSAKNQLPQAADEPVDLRMLMGIMTIPSAYERRALLRLAYSLQPRPVRAVVDVCFVLCTIDKEEDRILVSLEIIAHGDILVVNCTENMNDGKTYAYFSAVPRLFAAAPPYDYVGKTDDDTYYRVAALADSLRGKSRRDAYHGFSTPCHTDPERQYMSGMGYTSCRGTWWSGSRRRRSSPTTTTSGRTRTSAGGYARGGKKMNVYNEEPKMYDYWDREMDTGMNCFRHEHRADTVAVHKLKDRLKWARTLHFFNATQGLRPSELYHVDLENNIYKV